MKKLFTLYILPVSLFAQYHEDWSNVDNDYSSDNPFDFLTIVSFLFVLFLIYGHTSDKRNGSK